MAIRVAFFDCDGTLTKVRSSWEYLHRRFNLWEDNADLYQERFRSGEIDYGEFCRLDSILWKGTSLADVMEIVDEIPCHEGSLETIEALKAMGITPVIVSTGVSFLVGQVASKLGIDVSFANDLCEEEGVLNGDVRIHVHHEQKGDVVRDVLRRLGLDREDACAVGDGDGDRGMFEAVSLPIAFHPSGSIATVAQHTVPDGSLFRVFTIIRDHEST